MNLNFHNKKLFNLILLLVSLGLTQMLVAQDQRTFTICPGEEVVLFDFTGLPPAGGPPGTSPGVPGGPGQISGPFPCIEPVNLIEPKGGVIGFNRNSITVAPIAGPVGAGAPPCEPGPMFFHYYTVIVEECESTFCNTAEPFTGYRR